MTCPYFDTVEERLYQPPVVWKSTRHHPVKMLPYLVSNVCYLIQLPPFKLSEQINALNCAKVSSIVARFMFNVFIIFIWFIYFLATSTLALLMTAGFHFQLAAMNPHSDCVQIENIIQLMQSSILLVRNCEGVKKVWVSLSERNDAAGRENSWEDAENGSNRSGRKGLQHP